VNHLSLSSFSTERDLRLAILEAGRICYSNGLMHANTGNISIRMGNDRVVITPSKMCKGRLDPEDLLVIDLDGAIVKFDKTRKRTFSSEAQLHLEVYRRRPDVRAVIHSHPANATALTVAGLPFPMDILPEALEELGPVPTTRFALPDSADSAAAIGEYILDHNTILIRNHGAITFGADLEEALNRLELLEYIATTVLAAQLFGQVNHLPDEIMSAMREKYLKKRS